MTASELLPHLIRALEQNFDIHMQRIDDASVQILKLEELSATELLIDVTYREVMIRCCAGPSWNEMQTRKIKLIFRHGKWMDALLADTHS